MIVITFSSTQTNSWFWFLSEILFQEDLSLISYQAYLKIHFEKEWHSGRDPVLEPLIYNSFTALHAHTICLLQISMLLNGTWPRTVSLVAAAFVVSELSKCSAKGRQQQNTTWKMVIQLILHTCT